MTSAHQQPQSGAQLAKKVGQSSWPAIAAVAVAGLTAQYYFTAAPAIKAAPSTLEGCLNDVCAGRSDCVQFPDGNGGKELLSWARPFNLGRASVPSAIIRPKNAQEVAGAVKCASKHNVKVQAKAGGHSYGNYGLGGQDGAVSVDLENFQYVQVDNSDPSSNVVVGGGTRLGQIDETLRSHQRAIPHGACLGVGIGGHATVGGMGQMSRMWGTTLDHVEEVEVVTADGTVARASTRENPDLFFALRGAGAGFGIVTEFVMRTHPAPQSVLHYSYNFQYSRLPDMVDLFHDWQTVAADPALDQRLGTEIVLNPLGVRVSATWYGTEAELRQSGILDRLPAGSDPVVLRQESWDGSLAHLAMEEALHVPDAPGKFSSKSLGFTREDMLSRADIADLFGWLEEQRRTAGMWSIKFHAAGGTVSEVPAAATAYAHRDKVMFYQSHAACASGAQRGAKALVEDFHRKLLNMLPGAGGTYPGFVDPELRDAQRSYWGDNLPALEEIKGRWDPEDVFHNPQSVVSRAS